MRLSRKALTLVAMAAVIPMMVAGFGDAAAKTRTKTAEMGRKAFRLEAPVSCHAVCPYWIGMADDPYAAACEKDPLTVPGSWADKKIKVPRTIGKNKAVPFLLQFQIAPAVDYDSFVCRVISPGTSKERYVYYASGANSVGDCHYGCGERVFIPVKPGQVYVLRAYNWSDPAPYVVGEYSFFAKYRTRR